MLILPGARSIFIIIFCFDHNYSITINKDGYIEIKVKTSMASVVMSLIYMELNIMHVIILIQISVKKCCEINCTAISKLACPKLLGYLS